MATFFSLVNLVLKKKEKVTGIWYMAHYLWLTSTLEVKLLGAQSYYVHQIISLKAYFFAFPRSPSEFASSLVQL